jgi:integrase
MQYRKPNGRRVRESTGEASWPKAEKRLKDRLIEIGKRPHADPAAEAKVLVSELLDAVAQDYALNGRRSAATLAFRLVPLRTAFGDRRAQDVTTPAVESYKAGRLAEKVKPATVNRELAALRRAYRLGMKHGRISHGPGIELLAEHNAREGFLEPAMFAAVVEALPAYLQDAARFAYLSGWRKGEVATLVWADVDRSAGLITLKREHSKSGEPRRLPIVGELGELIERRWQARSLAGPGGAVTLCPLVFHRGGAPIGDFRKAWAKACASAKVPGTLFHDLRRSAIVNLDRAGVSQSVAMQISGHKTASVYRRYRIVAEHDLRAALERTLAANASATNPAVVSLKAHQGGR